ncbi:LysM peptidoglycan-binding domain-containing protein [Sphingomonas spermidinifaciens]|nr:LysM domain-containing protein [Sphingomonas spermidinifaciens]
MKWRTTGAASMALALAACGGGPRVAAPAPPPPAANPAAEIDAIAAMLDRGEARFARKRIAAALKRDPMNAGLLLLRDSIERDPVELLGPQSYSYVTRPGDTMAGIATRLLGNRLKAYQLARYNGIEVPASLAAGTTLRIPGQPPRPPAPVRRPDAAPRPAPAPAARPKPAPAAPARNPAAAARARAAGLAALNAGKANQAVMLLRRADALDPGNPAITRDLGRAERIAAAVRARR